MKLSSLHRAWYAVICGVSIFFYIQTVVFIADAIIHLGTER